MLNNLYFFLILFGIIFIAFLIFNKIKLKKHKESKIFEVDYLVNKFKLDRSKINYKAIIYVIALTNAFIIAFVCTIISILPLKIIWQMLIGFVALFVMIMLFYELIGIICVKKGWKKNANK